MPGTDEVDELSRPAPVRVVHADASFLMRAAVSDILRSEPDVELVATCPDTDTLLAAVEREQPDVVVTELWLPSSGDDDGMGIEQRLRRTHPQIGVVVLTQHADPRCLRDLIAGGAQGRAYVLKDRVDDQTDLLLAIDVVAHQGSMIDPSVLRLTLGLEHQSMNSVLEELTPREHAVLVAMASGKSNAAIAEEMTLTKRAVEKYVGAIFLKLLLPEEDHVSRRVTAVLIYMAHADQGHNHGAERHSRTNGGAAVSRSRSPTATDDGGR
jgi:DNA-binding NarL/FixJ family response regulator